MKSYIFLVMALFCQPLAAASFEVKADLGGGYQSPQSFGLWSPEVEAIGDARLGLSIGEQSYHTGIPGKDGHVRSKEVEFGLNKSSAFFEGLAVSQTVNLGYAQAKEVAGVSDKLQYGFLDYNVGFVVSASKKGEAASRIGIEPGVGWRLNFFDPREDHYVGSEVVETQSIYPYLRLSASFL